MVLRGRVAGGTAVLALLMCMPPRALTFTFVRRSSPVLHKGQHQQQQRQQQESSSSLGPSIGAARKRRRAHCIRCAAVALAVSGSSICEDGDTSSDSSLASAAGADRIEGATGDVGDVVVLSDWLDESPLSPLGLPEVDGRGQNADFRRQGQVEVVGDSTDEEPAAGDSSSAPFRFQQLIQVTLLLLLLL